MHPRSKQPFAPFTIEEIESRLLMSVGVHLVETPITAAAITADSQLSNYKSYDLQVTVAAGDDWTSGDLKVSLTSGKLYVPPTDNGNTAQTPLWSSKPNLRFDTFVTAPNFGNPLLAVIK